METKHTKGKWMLIYKTPSTIQIKAHIGFICELPPVKTEADLFEAQANAKLIAAAPELLEALIEAKQRLYGGFTRDDLTTSGKELFDKLTNVIKKATE